MGEKGCGGHLDWEFVCRYFPVNAKKTSGIVGASLELLPCVAFPTKERPLWYREG